MFRFFASLITGSLIGCGSPKAQLEQRYQNTKELNQHLAEARRPAQERPAEKVENRADDNYYPYG